jgi:hypothetical protein
MRPLLQVDASEPFSGAVHGGFALEHAIAIDPDPGCRGEVAVQPEGARAPVVRLLDRNEGLEIVDAALSKRRRQTNAAAEIRLGPLPVHRSILGVPRRDISLSDRGIVFDGEATVEIERSPGREPRGGAPGRWKSECVGAVRLFRLGVLPGSKIDDLRAHR